MKQKYAPLYKNMGTRTNHGSTIILENRVSFTRYRRFVSFETYKFLLKNKNKNIEYRCCGKWMGLNLGQGFFGHVEDLRVRPLCFEEGFLKKSSS